MKTTYRHKLYAWCMTRLPKVFFFVYQVLGTNLFSVFFYRSINNTQIIILVLQNYIVVLKYETRPKINYIKNVLQLSFLLKSFINYCNYLNDIFKNKLFGN